MSTRAKRIVLLLLAVALVSTLLLSMSLSGLQLQPGSPFPGASGDAATPEAGTPTTASHGSAAAIEAVLGVVLIVLVVYLPIRLGRLLRARNILWLAAGFFLLLGVLSILPRVLPGPAMLLADETTTAATPQTYAYPVSPLGEPPAPFRWLSIAGLLAGASLLAVLLVRHRPERSSAADAVRQEAEKALQGLQAGEAFRDVIIRCYLQMTDVLRREQKLERRESMTAREFQDWLEASGIPAAPVERLTALFEAVRYGNIQPGPEAEQAGVECLQQITRYCGAGSGAR